VEALLNLRLPRKGSHSDRLLAWLLFVSALVVRFRYLLWIEHNVDHAYYVGQALRTLTEGYLPVIGQATSLQFPNSAFLGYLYVPLLALTHHVLSAYVLVIALNSLGVVFVYRSARLLGMSRFAAVCGGAFYVFNPWLIEYTRSTWSYSIMPFLLTCLFYSLLLACRTAGKRQTVSLIVAATATSLTTLITLTGYLILPTLVVYGLVFRRSLPWGKILRVMPIVIIPNAVFVVSLLADWENTSARAASFLRASQASALRAEPIQHSLRLVNGADYELQRGLKIAAEQDELQNQIGRALQIVVTVFTAVGTVSAFRKRQKGVILWAATPVVFLSYNSALIHPFYLLLTIPAWIILTAQGIQEAAATLKYSKTLVALVVVVWSCIALRNSERYYQETQQFPGDHGLTALPLHVGLQLGRAVADNLSGGIVQFEVEPWILHSFSGMVLPTTDILDNKQRIVVPPEGLLIITTEVNEAPQLVNTEIAWEKTLPDQTKVRVLKASNAAPTDITETAYEGAGDVALIGYQLKPTENGAQFSMYWRVNNQPQDLSPLYSPTVHVYQNDERTHIVDGKPIYTYLWTPNTLMAHRVTLPIALTGESSFTLRIGLYDGVRNQHALVSAQEGDGLLSISVIWP
jgi:hypothetical protein